MKNLYWFEWIVIICVIYTLSVTGLCVYQYTEIAMLEDYNETIQLKYDTITGVIGNKLDGVVSCTESGQRLAITEFNIQLRADEENTD